MTYDIGHILDDWPHEGGQLSARRIRGDDGKDKLQLRLELGILQMEITGRPDGERPYGYESVLTYYQEKLKRFRDADEESDFRLDERACEMLRAEAVMYYHRYLTGFILEDYALVETDTLRNLELMDFCTQYAVEDTDKYLLEQYRPYVVMMLARARARMALADSRPKVALAAVRDAITDIRNHYEQFGADEEEVTSSELAILQALASEIEQRVPVDPVSKLRKQLDQAIAEERYEDAANLRDQLSRLAQDPDHRRSISPDNGADAV
ncbi:MAG: UvrB/UvrC motif-containing protein [Planctomycetota bacterium]|jgi:hypothetical protein